jgi:thermitase
MPPSDDQLTRYNQRRQSRLQSLPTLRYAPAGASRAWYVAGELLVVDEGRRQVERYIARDPGALAAARDEEVVPGLHRYHVPGLDVPATVRAIRGSLPAGATVASPNHVFLASPFNHGGPFGPPTRTTGSTVNPRTATTDLVPVTIIDTGLWTETVLPGDYLRAGGIEYETQTDVDNDGLLDGDVGHANFIAGVIAMHAGRVELSVLRVLDTFGICTEEALVQAIGRIDPATKVINLSLGGFTPGDVEPVGLRVALEGALSGQNRVAIAAAGNDGNRTNPFWPAAFAGSGASWSGQVAAVAAHDGTRLCTWSNAGPWVTLAAPGEDIESTFIKHQQFFPEGWALWSGTSFATPRVVAEVATRIGDSPSAPAALDEVVNAVRAADVRFGDFYGLV